MRFAVIVFPGSNCDHDAHHAAKEVLGQEAEFVWHKETDLRGADVVILPGGFSHGDYLRTGAIARFSPVMDAVRKFAADGGPFSVSATAFRFARSRLAAGRDASQSRPEVRCEHVYVRVEQTDTPSRWRAGRSKCCASPSRTEKETTSRHRTAAHARTERQVVFRYVDADGAVTDDANPNGSVQSIAGICNERRNVVGLMPHPERACELSVGSADGLVMFESVVKAHAAGALTPAGSASA